MDHAPGFSGVAFGGRRPPEGTFICTAEGLPLDSPFPVLWIAGRDASDPAAGVHCTRIESPFARAGARALELLEKIPH